MLTPRNKQTPNGPRSRQPPSKMGRPCNSSSQQWTTCDSLTKRFHVIDVGHSLVNPDQQDKAYGINMSGDPNLFVGTNTVEPTMDTMSLNTLLNAPGITDPSVDIFSCNSADLSDAYISDGAHLFTGISSGPDVKTI